MKKALFALAASALALPVAAQITVDDFSGYADQAELGSTYAHTGGFSTVVYQATGGAEDNGPYMEIGDGGFSAGLSAVDVAGPPATAGNYQMNFFYQNGQTGDQPWNGLQVAIIQDGNQVLTSDELGIADDTTVVDSWTAESSNIGALDNVSSLTVTILSASGNGGGADHRAAIDNITISEILALPLDLAVTPNDSLIQSGSITIAATPSGGTEPYTQVTFDIGNDASIESTDTTAPFEYVWDTTGADGTDGSTLFAEATVDVAVTVTDSNSDQVTEVLTFTLDNRLDNRQNVVGAIGNFDSFTGGNPDGWVAFQDTSGNATTTNAASFDSGSDDALSVTFTAQDFTNRYVWRTPAITNDSSGLWEDFQTSYWGIGTSNRMYYALSTDGGSTFAPQIGTAAAQVNASTWTFTVGPVVESISTDADDQMALATHQFNTDEHRWDEVVWTANQLPAPSGATTWDMYR